MRRFLLLFAITLTIAAMPGCFFPSGHHGGGGGGGNGGGGGGGGTPPPISVTLTPSTPQTLLPGATLSITSNVTVNWTLNQNAAGVLTNMAPNGVTYNAPFVVSTSVTDTVTATSTADPTKSATLKITTNPTTSFLFGQFAFLFTGFDANGAVSIAGGFTVDQHGNITGEQDFKDPKTASSTPQTITGTAANSPVANAGLLTITAGGKTSKYVFDLRANFFNGRFAEDPSDGTGVTGSGVLIGQDPTAFNLTGPGTSFSGNFTMGFVGTDAAGGRLSVVGTFFDDLGAHINGGEADVNDNSTLITQAKVAGALTGPVDSDGRATAQVTITGPSSVETLNLAFYIVGVGSAFATDITLPGPTAQVLGGQLLAILPKNPAGQNGFGNTSLHGNTVFDLWGASAGPPVAADTTIGLFSVPGAGSPAVLVDMNNAGAVLTNQQGSVANISIDSFGRGTFDMTVNGQAQRSFVVYLDTTNDGFLQETTGTAVNFGFIQAQKGTFDNAHIFGTYAAATFLPPVPNSPDFAGPVTLNPTGQSGSTFSGTFTAGKVTGNYSFDSASGRGTATSTNMATALGTNLAFYIITPGKIVVMGVDNINQNDNIEYVVF
jgi:hypothetical protein